MAQNKTSLILNNLVALSYPIKTSQYVTSSSRQDTDGQTELLLQLPFFALLQKVELQDTGRTTPSKILSVLRQQQSDPAVWQEVIDFKKQKINWRFKSRVRSNSNEFIEGFLNTSTPQTSRKSSLSNSSSLQIVRDSDLDEEVRGTLVCGACSVFKVLVEGDCSPDATLSIAVWPTMRMPTGSSAIPLINNSFLFAKRDHVEESNEIDFLVAQALLNARKFIQASEKIRGIEQRQLEEGTRDSLYRVMLLEIIIGESMSQHSQVSEKIYAFQRAAMIYQWLSIGSEDVQQLYMAFFQMPKQQVKQDEAPQKLFQIKQRLVAVLIANIGSHIEVVRMAVLKTLEYLLDTLNCSLENQILDILKVVCFCYPNSETTQHGTEQILSFFKYKFASQTEITEQRSFFSWYSIHNETDCKVLDVKQLSHSYVQSAKNWYNHILENIGIVLASASHSLLTSIFRQIVIPQALNPKLPQELRIYLLKYADQILNLCQGDVNLPATFLKEIIEIIIEQPDKPSATKPTKRHRAQSAATQAVSPHFSNLQQICLDLLETIKHQYFTSLNLNSAGGQQNTQNQIKGQKTYEWLVNQLNDLVHSLQNKATISVIEQRKLNILLGIVEQVVSVTIAQEYRVSKKERLQTVYCRSDDALPPEESQLLQKRAFESASSEMEEGAAAHKADQQKPKQSLMQSKPTQQRMNHNLQYLQVFLPLAQPLINLFNYSVANQERLHLFKQVWQILTQVLSRLPVKLTRMPHLTLSQLVKPHIDRLTAFMQQSSPSKQMLEFLQIVLCSVDTLVDEMRDTLLPTLLQTIPHNLHDEVFQVTSLILDIQSEISVDNMKLLLSVLVHKYTMRSKEHRRLVDAVVSRTILGQQSKQIFDCFLSECLFVNTLGPESTQDDEQVYFEKLGLLKEVVQQMSEPHVWHFRRLLLKSQLEFSRIFQVNIRSKQLMVKLLLKMSEFYMKHCAPSNYYEYPLLAQQTNDEAMQRAPQQIPFAPPLPQRIARQNMVYSEPDVELFSIEHHEDYLNMSVPPRVEMDPQVAAYLRPEVEPQQRRQHYRSQHFDIGPQIQLNTQQEMQNQADQESELYESPRQMLVLPSTQMICDQVNLIDSERLLLVRCHAAMIRQVVEEQPLTEGTYANAGEGMNQDANVKLCVLNLMQNMFANLLPTPSLKNMIVQNLIGQEKVTLVQPARMQPVCQMLVNDQTPVPSSEEGDDDDEGLESPALATDHQVLPESATAVAEQQQTTQHELIPDLADLLITGDETSTFPHEVECSDQKYLCARVLAFLKISKYLEQIITTTSWANLKQLAISVLNLGCAIPNVNILPSKLQRHLKNALQQLIVKLVQNLRDSESRASALNTLACLCNLQMKQLSGFFSEAHNDSLLLDQQSPSKFATGCLNPQLDDHPLTLDLEVVKHVDLFRVNSGFVSVAIWQEIFDLQEDQNALIRDAATALIQLCAPRESVTHFLQIKREQYKLKVNQILQKSVFTNSTSNPAYLSQQSQMDQTTSNNFTSTMQLNTFDEQAVCSEQSSSSDDDRSSLAQQQLTEADIRATLHIFNLKCSPILSLQTDRLQREQHIDSTKKKMFPFQDFYEDQFLIDEKVLPQRGVPSLQRQQDDESDEIHSESSSDEVYIFRRQDSGRLGRSSQTASDAAEQKPSKIMQEASATQLIQVLQQENEDLGIIDLDNSELDDFEELDDDKLPILKNTYSKKNRPNNSKAVAIGSRTQGLKQEILRTQLVQAELLGELEKQSLLQKRQSEIAENESLEYELSHRGGVSVASLPLASERQHRQIQSAGGKRNTLTATSYQSSTNVQQHMLSHGETLLLPKDLNNLDIEEVQIFVKRKQRPVSSRGSVLSSLTSQDQRLNQQLMLTEQTKTNKLIQTEEESKQPQAREPCEVQAQSTHKQSSVKKAGKPPGQSSNVVRVISKVTRPETVQKHKQLVTKQSGIKKTQSTPNPKEAIVDHSRSNANSNNPPQKVKRTEIHILSTQQQQQTPLTQSSKKPSHKQQSSSTQPEDDGTRVTDIL